MKLSTIKIYIAGILFLSVGSCTKDFLDRTPLDIVSDDDVWSSAASIEANLVVLYNNMQAEDFNYTVSDEAGYLSQATDEALRTYLWGNFAIQSDIPTNVYGWWGYGSVRQVNMFMEKLSGGNLSEDQKKNYMAEARFLRAFYYFSMVKRYGGVPIIDKVQEYSGGDITPLQVSRNTEQQTYDFILKELNEVYTQLPANREDSGRFRATRWAALALKCRAMLYAASIAKYANVQLNGLIGIPKDQAQRYYTEALNASKEIIDSGKFALYSKSDDKAENFQQLFLDKSMHSEAIFVKAFRAPDKTHSFDFYNAPHSFRVDYGSTTNPTIDMVEAFEYTDGTPGKLKLKDAAGNAIKYASPVDLFKGKDPRFFATILYPMAPWQGSIVEVRRGIIDNGRKIESGNLTDKYGSGTEAITIVGKDGPLTTWDPTKTGFYLKKFLSPTSRIPQGRSDMNWMIFRLGEIYLNGAEAAYELGNSGLALQYINKIRNRAGIVEKTTLDLETIRHERFVELAFENHRLWDLRRWRTGTTVINNRQFKGLYPYMIWQDKTYIFEEAALTRPNKTFTEKLYWEAIPGISANPNLIQNPLY
ncbi:RagB/SusD family nutrient uptake outer membrane protein [Elizabethkingia anophelis]|uniref:RagB/SusD family nutrient uptake outer membrane protein n=1 Tax=Elizabethkingia anophelis TaxID=1117645 RepID=UPI000C9A9C45|nr:RagB/SusD family nutrient uptake outer membrane protein [Elizabethkingia anophelis]MCT3758744.1 RagB/SusD family nutrient uptake outer membrane protein [Elizabethkingia anophelis]MCT3973732.1 RagB/SusD family nutrient uptake outer membrane protein [Elizabethkingia anophelis]MCT4002024.1 RagB/SusD family nutrient uptake outer membrane protein [Elizabethkingia anophelis]MCT4015925.1 RagB/SusD family nutrient uptake outer membrane protein [Elizabethkingia anophelis]MCT4019605.1 RagB/SusD famil